MTDFIIPRGEVHDGEEAEFLKFICPPKFSGGPFDRQKETRTLSRKLDTKFDLDLPDGVLTQDGSRKLRMWIIENPDADRTPEDPRRAFPSPIIRTVEGDVVHATVSFSFNVHTIHWHGIDPSPLNDGVGHTSFEASSRFVYQFATHQAGTYFYHCHRNTTLHFEMGMYGLLVVDPPHPDLGPKDRPEPFPTFGPGFVAANLEGFTDIFPDFRADKLVAPYDQEVLWVTDEFDSKWHDEFGHSEAMQGCDSDDPMGAGTFEDGILNDFRPDIFAITGVVSVPEGRQGAFPEVGRPITGFPAAVTAEKDTTVLIRLVNASYLIHEHTLGIDALCIAADGGPFGVSSRGQYSAPFVIPKNTPFRLTSARRVDLLIRPEEVGQIPFTVKYYDWVRGPDSADPLLFHTARTQITVIDPSRGPESPAGRGPTRPTGRG
jgi:FtsP/CotA-like multicopper oxidase with cupredoxin domain